MDDVCGLEPDDQRPEFREPQPLRHLTLENAAFALTHASAFAGNHQHQPSAP